MSDIFETYGINLQRNPRELAANFTGVYIGIGLIAAVAIAALIIGWISLSKTKDKDKNNCH